MHEFFSLSLGNPGQERPKLCIYECAAYTLRCSRAAHAVKLIFHEPGVSKIYLVHGKDAQRIQFSLCSRKKLTNSLFMRNGMRTVRRWSSAGSQSGPHIRAFGSRTIWRARVYEAQGLSKTDERRE